MASDAERIEALEKLVAEQSRMLDLLRTRLDAPEAAATPPVCSPALIVGTEEASDREERLLDRRAAFKVGVASLGALAVGELASSSPAAAANGQPWVLGTGNSASHVTTLNSTSAGLGVSASTAYALYGFSAYAKGVYGRTNGGIGVYGQTASGYGVYGNATSGFAAGVYGQAIAGHGVHGKATDEAGKGVYGEGAYGVVGDGLGCGVQGSASASGGTGVRGRCHSGTGVSGESTHGIGMWGGSENGYGVKATSTNEYALFAEGLLSSGVRAQGSNNGVDAVGGKRGGRFDAGAQANITLPPAQTATPPTSNQAAGDIWVGSDAKLWFYDGTSWQLVAFAQT